MKRGPFLFYTVVAFSKQVRVRSEHGVGKHVFRDLLVACICVCGIVCLSSVCLSVEAVPTFSCLDYKKRDRSCKREKRPSQISIPDGFATYTKIKWQPKQGKQTQGQGYTESPSSFPFPNAKGCLLSCVYRPKINKRYFLVAPKRERKRTAFLSLLIGGKKQSAVGIFFFCHPLPFLCLPVAVHIQPLSEEKYLDAIGDDEDKCLGEEETEETVVEVGVRFAVEDGDTSDNDPRHNKREHLLEVYCNW